MLSSRVFVISSWQSKVPLISIVHALQMVNYLVPIPKTLASYLPKVKHRP